MKFDTVISMIGTLPGTENSKGKILHDFIISRNIHSILEIGFFHGKSTNFMAAALEELGAGKVTTIDITGANKYSPNIIELSSRTGLLPFIDPIFSEHGSQWEMRRLIHDNSQDDVCSPIFDFCFIDAYHSWECAGLDFFLAEKLLKPGGWILFDDLDWSFDTSPTWKNRPETKAMSDAYRSAKQVREVFALLVKQHPQFVECTEDDGWGWARKKPTPVPEGAI
jgi:predicted O-methyltransferase YrrM